MGEDTNDTEIIIEDTEERGFVKIPTVAKVIYS